ncbi:COG4223 family protein [Tabrizicola sp.]|uniref:COG4223 family protein n=1 Tax=Tabrizicola sp. TaxID=2005166 RepID=UPI0035B065C3
MARRKDPLTEAEAEAAADTPAEAAAESPSLPPDALPADALAAEVLPHPDSAPADPAAVPPPSPPPRRGPGILGPLLGGALAALGGFALSHYNVFGLVPPPTPPADLAPLAQADQDQAAALAALRSEVGTVATRLAALEGAPASQPDTARLDDLDQRLAAIESLPQDGDAGTAALAARLAKLEQQLSAQPAAADQAEVDAALARLAEAEAEASRRAEEATAAAEAAAHKARLDQLREAVASGVPFEAELAALNDPDLAASLSPHAAGIATLAALQADFPEAARQALQLARANAPDTGWGARLTDFLAAQTGARSLTPREGDDPDAVLSRAEFALSEGRLADALAEVKTLPEPIRAPLADWSARAEARLTVLAALEGK